LGLATKDLPWYYITSAVKSGATSEIESLIDEMNRGFFKLLS
jgi:hypothetical protein